MKKQEFIEKWYVPGNYQKYESDLDSVIQTAIAEHEEVQDNDFWFDQMNSRFPDLVREIMDSDEYFKHNEP